MFLHRKNANYFYDRHQKVFETLYSRRYCNDHQGSRSEKFPYPDRSIWQYIAHFFGCTTNVKSEE